MLLQSDKAIDWKYDPSGEGTFYMIGLGFAFLRVLPHIRKQCRLDEPKIDASNALRDIYMRIVCKDW